MTPFTVFAAVDVAGGKCVRLRHGDPAATTVYHDDPVAAALHWQGEGAAALHVVDLDATLGRGSNAEVIARLVREVDVPVQVGGGIRDAASFESAIATGAATVVVGTAAVEHPDLVEALVSAHRGRVVVAADVRGDEVAVEGWTRGSGMSLEDLARRYSYPGVAGLLVTDIGRDGALEGPAVELYERLSRLTDVPVIASGGVRDAGDVAAVAAAGAAGVVVGTALYEGRLRLADALWATRAGRAE